MRVVGPAAGADATREVAVALETAVVMVRSVVVALAAPC